MKISASMMNVLTWLLFSWLSGSQLFMHVWGCKMSERGLDDKTKALILDLHNKARQKVANGEESGQPPASNMKELHWDNEIAAIAQRVAENCIFQHTPQAQRTTKNYEYLGENIYAGSYPDPIPRSVKKWYEEVKDVTPAIVSSYSKPGNAIIGHFTQMVYANTEALGCGYAKSADDGEAFVFCLYGPGGNYPGKPVYKQGSPASECKNGKSTRYNGLCK
uniref:Cysteine-rich venom protein n=1 Tax=Scolopendra viridis TaxID=118503 RepID=A0A4D5R9Y7_SCOVI